MSLDDVLERGVDRVVRNLCPACDMLDKEVALQVKMPEGFHYHGAEPDPEQPYLYCPEDGQGYRIVNGQMRIQVPCNGGLHADGMVGYR